jgi:hypothetical protein
MNLNVTIDVLDIRHVSFPNGGFDLLRPVIVALIAMMIVYIVSTCVTLYKFVAAPAPAVQYGQLEYGTEVTL